MEAPVENLSAELLCHVCGYDLRAHSPDARCPECGASVAEARRVAAIPRRPAWRDSDPRWRRRMLAGAWILVLVPLMNALDALEWSSSIPVPTVFDYRGTVLTLDHTLLSDTIFYTPLVFCIGVVLLFAKERRHHRGKLDWTRRWGVICTYIALLLNAVSNLLLPALVLAGIAAMYQGMPPPYQPKVTQLFVNISTTYLRYGPYPSDAAYILLAATPSNVMLLACIALFDALRSSGPKWLAATLLAPLALFALLHLGQVALAGWSCLSSSELDWKGLGWLNTYFRPYLLQRYIDGHWSSFISVSLITFLIEIVKWCAILAIALWLTIAQIAAHRQRKL